MSHHQPTSEMPFIWHFAGGPCYLGSFVIFQAIWPRSIAKKPYIFVIFFFGGGGGEGGLGRGGESGPSVPPSGSTHVYNTYDFFELHLFNQCWKGRYITMKIKYLFSVLTFAKPSCDNVLQPHSFAVHHTWAWQTLTYGKECFILLIQHTADCTAYTNLTITT